ncbi:MAG TPA: protein phosphatase 2C domain-containing protein [Myxococcota bacterium]|nr:protein phosphatase 2C domain-containing protein [Myxococcota bacterium]
MLFEKIFAGADLSEPTSVEMESGLAVVISRTAPGKTTGNEDAAGLWEISPGVCVLAVADGVGGGPGGAEAASSAIHAIGNGVRTAEDADAVRAGILDGFDAANRAVLEQGIGAGTTLVVAELREGRLRTYHAGDSGALWVGGRGRIRNETIHHSPVGYLVASGLIDPSESHHHAERHLLSNCIGSHEMRIEIGALSRMAARDTLLLATDGVLDNVRRRELVNTIRVGPLPRASAALLERATATMGGEDPDLPAHPDDATALLFRWNRR